MAEIRTPPAILEQFCCDLLLAGGSSAGNARIEARALVRTEARGIYTHGVFRLPLYLRRMQAGGIDPKAVPTVIAENGATAVVDAHNALGAIAGHFAMHHALGLAARYGVGTVACRNSNHFGAAAEYALSAPPAECIGIAMTNAPAVMSPWQGRSLLLGNNPLAVAAPTDGEPFVLDMAVSQVAKGKIRVAAAEGKAIPLGWALDRNGSPTTDAQTALAGLLVPSGGHKGYGLSLAVEILAGVLAGATLAPTMPSQDQVDQGGGVGHFFVALDVGRFIPLPVFKLHLSDLLSTMRAAHALEEFDGIYVHGDLEAEAERTAFRDGVPIYESTWHALLEAAHALGVEPPASGALAESPPR